MECGLVVVVFFFGQLDGEEGSVLLNAQFPAYDLLPVNSNVMAPDNHPRLISRRHLFRLLLPRVNVHADVQARRHLLVVVDALEFVRGHKDGGVAWLVRMADLSIRGWCWSGGGDVGEKEKEREEGTGSAHNRRLYTVVCGVLCSGRCAV